MFVYSSTLVFIRDFSYCIFDNIKCFLYYAATFIIKYVGYFCRRDSVYADHIYNPIGPISRCSPVVNSSMLGPVLVLTLLLLPFSTSRKHHLEIQNDVRQSIPLSTFGFYTGGTCHGVLFMKNSSLKNTATELSLNFLHFISP